jgi:Cu/Ag efflux protein CusF
MADVFALQDELTRAIVSNLAAFAVKTTGSGTQRVRVEGVGTVIKVRIKKKRVTLDHLEIKGFMEAMEMSYKVNSAALLDGLEPGEKVFFTLDIENKTITAIRPQNEK